MKIEKTEWDGLEYAGEISFAIFGNDSREQPGFGWELLWNTNNLLKPVLVIHFWHWRIQIGWLVD